MDSLNTCTVNTLYCIGALYCDESLRARGFNGEGYRSGAVLIVKTHYLPLQRPVSNDNDLNINWYMHSQGLSYALLRGELHSQGKDLCYVLKTIGLIGKT